MRYITGYTINTPYEQEARELQASGKQFGIEVLAYPYVNSGSWERNCGKKPSILHEALMTYREPVCWLDADARILAPPVFLDSLPLDFAVCGFYREKFGHELISGTIAFGKNAAYILQEWFRICWNKPLVWDQQILQGIIEQQSIPVIPLPIEYQAIEFGDDMPTSNVVIQHHQRSNRYKERINS